LTVEEAKAQGVDLKSLEKVDARDSAVAPASAPASATAALDEKLEELKLNTAHSSAPSAQADLPLPHGDAPKSEFPSVHTDQVESNDTGSESKDIGNLLDTKEDTHHSNDIPAQNETSDNHKHIPMPVITAIGEKDPAKDRSLESTNHDDTAATKPIDANPGVSAKDAKHEAQNSRGGTGSTPAAMTGKVIPTPTPAHTSTATPVKPATAPAQVPAVVNAPATVVPTTTSVPTPANVTPVVPAAPVTASPAAPSTPSKSTAVPAQVYTPASMSSPTASPQAAHGKDASSASVKKRKSGFLHKVSLGVS
jgi:hypothetical protein